MSGIPPVGGPNGPFQANQGNVKNIPPSWVVPATLSEIPEGDTKDLQPVASAIKAMVHGAKKKLDKENKE